MESLGTGTNGGRPFFTFLLFYLLKPLQVGDDGLGVGSYLRF